MLRCALGFLSIGSLEQIPAAVLNAETQIPDWTGIRRELEERTRAIKRKAERLHLGGD